ncbi:MAG: hypothetical protein RL448_728 [Actinomycetota bacterium]
MTGALTLLVFVEVLVFVTGALTVFEIDGDTVVMMLVVGVCDFVKFAINSINFNKSAALNPAEAPSVETGETGVVEVGVVGVVDVGVVAGVVAGSVVGVVPSTAAPAVNFDVDLTLYFLKYLTFEAAFLATFFFTIFVATPPAGLISLNPETAAFDAGAIPSSDAVMPRATTFFTVFILGRPFTLLSLINEWEPRFVTTNYN